MEKFVRSKSPVTGGFTVVSAGYEIDWGGKKESTELLYFSFIQDQ